MSSPLIVPSQRFGTYSITRKLGEGGMAEVFHAEAADDDGELVEVAIKFMKPGAAVPGADAAELFATEADVMGMLRHPNLVQLHEVGKHQDRLFLAMEYVLGADLETLMKMLRAEGRLFPPSLALTIGIDLLKALAYLHQATTVRGTPLGLVHGDINPANVFLSATQGTAKLGDFGVVQSGAIAGGLPEGMSAGKLHHLSPEQAAGKPLNATSDLFAVGVIMFELLVGVRPFDGRDAKEVLERIVAGKFVRPKDLSRGDEKLFEKALARSPRSRFQTGGQFAGELLRYQLDSDLQMSPASVREMMSEMLGIVT